MYIKKAKVIVLKIGSSNIVDSRGKLREKWLKSLVKDIKKLSQQRQRICHCFIWRYCPWSKLFKN